MSQANQGSSFSYQRRVRCCILGSGLHACALLRLLAQRGWRDILLAEPASFRHPVAAEHPFLFHSGLREFSELSEVPFLLEAHEEQTFLREFAPDLLNPIPTCFTPASDEEIGYLRWFAAAAILRLFGRAPRPGACRAAREPASPRRRLLPTFSHWSEDLVGDDRAIAHRALLAAQELGATTMEDWIPARLGRTEDGWEITFIRPDGAQRVISALYVVNFLGPLTRGLLESSGLKPTHRALDGGWLAVPCEGPLLSEALCIGAPTSAAPLAIFPFNGSNWVVGRLLSGIQNHIEQPPGAPDIESLLAAASARIGRPLTAHHEKRPFWRNAWFAATSLSLEQSVSSLPIVGIHRSARGMLLTLYGGTTISCRKTAERLAAKITEHFGDDAPNISSLAKPEIV